MKKIINLTQHISTNAQKEEGVVDLPETLRKELINLLTFEEMPDKNEILKRSKSIKDLALKVMNILNIDNGDGYFMIGGAPYLMPLLIEEIKCIGRTLFAFSKREVQENVLLNGIVEKKIVFKHEGFIEI